MSSLDAPRKLSHFRSKHTLPGEVCVVLVDQIFLDPEIIVACWEEDNLLMWGVVTIPKSKM